MSTSWRAVLHRRCSATHVLNELSLQLGLRAWPPAGLAALPALRLPLLQQEHTCSFCPGMRCQIGSCSCRAPEGTGVLSVPHLQASCLTMPRRPRPCAQEDCSTPPCSRNHVRTLEVGEGARAGFANRARQSLVRSSGQRVCNFSGVCWERGAAGSSRSQIRGPRSGTSTWRLESRRRMPACM